MPPTRAGCEHSNSTRAKPRVEDRRCPQRTCLSSAVRTVSGREEPGRSFGFRAVASRTRCVPAYKDSSDKLLATTRRVPLPLPHRGYRYRSQAVSPEARAYPSPRRANCSRSQGNSRRCPGRDYRTYGWRSRPARGPRWLADGLSCSTSVLVEALAEAAPTAAASRRHPPWSPTGSRQTEIRRIGKMAGGRSSGCRPLVLFWSVPIALWPGAAPYRSILNGNLRPYSGRPRSACARSNTSTNQQIVRNETTRVTDGSTPSHIFITSAKNT